MSFSSCSTLVGATGGLLVLMLPVSALEPPAPPQAVRADDRNEPLVLEFDDFVLFASEDVEVISIPDSVRRLDGRRVRIRGFMVPPCLEHGNPGFVAIPEVRMENRIRPRSDYCSGGTLPIRDRLERVRYAVPVLLEEGKTIDWTSDRQRQPLVIEGILRHRETMDLEFEPYPFWIEVGTYREVEPREGYGLLWPIWPGC